MEERKFFGATYIDTVTNGIIEHGIIELNNNIIEQVYHSNEFEQQHPDKAAHVVWHNGIIIPGLINSHCHLELSYLKNAITKRTGLNHFIAELEKKKSHDKSNVLHKALEADTEMRQNGIVYVGDICNTLDAQLAKDQSAITYYHFCEVYAINEHKAESAHQRIKAMSACIDSDYKSIVPHAPYSVSKKLFELIYQDEQAFICIHNQETMAEDEMFIDKTGALVERLLSWGIDLDGFQPSGCTSLETYLKYFPASKKTMLVHNTYTSDALIKKFANSNIYWCLCPSANLFIENKLPSLETFFLLTDNCLVGTDSLASNDELNIIAELKIIYDYLVAKNNSIPAQEIFSRLLRFATLNGATFFNCEKHLGSIEPGKSPGLVLLENGDFNFSYTAIKTLA